MKKLLGFFPGLAFAGTAFAGGPSIKKGGTKNEN
jgi:hypothetical protein